MIYHAGHEPPAVQKPKRQIEFFLRHGYDVAAISMPLYEFAAPPSALELAQGKPACDGWNVPHQLFYCVPRAMRKFIAPVAVTLNTLAARYRSVDMVGLSGGGWTTVVAAAVDQRIRRSYPVAGSWPIYLMRTAGRVGDDEFEHEAMLAAESYQDMYALAREQLAFWIEKDRAASRDRRSGPSSRWSSASRPPSVR